MKPIRGKCFIMRDEEENKTPGGIIIPLESKEYNVQGVVVALGDWEKNELDIELDPEFGVGDTVMFDKYKGKELVVDGNKVLICRQSDVVMRL